MSIIAVKGIPSSFSLLDVVKTLGELVAGPFEPLNFTDNKHYVKTCYLRLSETLDPVRVVERISSTSIQSYKFNKPIALTLTAYVPETVPDLPLPEKRRKIPKKLRNQLKLPEFELPHEVIVNTHHELFLEIQYKYPGLYNLSRKTSHKLLDEIAVIIGDRLKHVMDANPETRDSCFKLSKCYRRTHPHFGDFQLLLSTLHRLQDAAGAPRTQIQESELLALPTPPQMINDVPVEQVRSAGAKYGARVAAALGAHVAALDSELAPHDSEEDTARKKVREELKKIMPYVPTALKQVISGHFVPDREQQYRRIRIYGEPFLPSRDAMAPFTRRYTAGAMRVTRSHRMYNLLMFRVPQHTYAPLRAMDATVINGAKLTIRSDVPTHPASEELRARLAAHCGGTARALPAHDDDDDDDDDELC